MIKQHLLILINVQTDQKWVHASATVIRALVFLAVVAATMTATITTEAAELLLTTTILEEELSLLTKDSITTSQDF